jgi:hypothetical protein
VTPASTTRTYIVTVTPMGNPLLNVTNPGPVTVVVTII